MAVSGNDGGLRQRGPLLLLVILLVCTSTANAERRSLSSIVETADAGAPGLALDLLARHQPPAAQAPASWQRWERARIRILADQQAWDRAIEQLADLPAAAPPEYRRWALEQRAALHLERDQAEAALAALRRLLWRRASEADREGLRRWQRLVVRAHLANGAVEDAVTATRRLDQDDPDGSREWQALRARVLLRSGRPAEALSRLPGDAGGELLALRLLAEIQQGDRSLERIIADAEAAAGNEEAARAQRARLQAVIARAAALQDAPGRRAVAVERAFAVAGALPADDVLFAIDADQLWTAWLTWGRRIGNDRRLLLGADAAWLAEVDEALPRYPVRARALLAVVAIHGGTAEARRQAHGRLVEEITQRGPGGADTARRVYLDSHRFADLTAIPRGVRYRLVDEALARDDLDLATRLMRDLIAAPDDRDPFDWRLLRARVLVLGGEPLQGAEAVERLLAEHPEIPAERLDRLLQIVFDLQGAREHERALELLARVGERELDGQRRRELLYWQAESEEALGHHRRAAELYMRSATLLDGLGGDQWGQTARYQAAGQLAEFGLVNDARRIYGVLLRVTEDPGRRAQLRNRIQRLGLRDSGEGDLPIPAD